MPRIDASAWALVLAMVLGLWSSPLAAQDRVDPREERARTDPAIAGEAPPAPETPLAGEAPVVPGGGVTSQGSVGLRGTLGDTPDLVPTVAPIVDLTTNVLTAETDTRRVAPAAPVLATPYEPIGIRRYGFLWFPELATNAVFDDNVFAVPTNKRSDVAAEFRPRLRMQSEWKNHALAAEASGLLSYYNEFPSEDDRAYDTRVRGRIDVRRRTNIELEAASSLAQEDRSSLDLPEDAAERADVHVNGIGGALNHRFNRLSVRGQLLATDIDYDDVRLNNGDIANNDDRDLVEGEQIFRATYEFQPRLSVFVQGSHNDRIFRSPFDDDGFRRDSQGEEAIGGLKFKLGPAITGEVGLGYAWQRPDDPAFEMIEGTILNADVVWRPTVLTSLRFTATSEIGDTTRIDSAGALIRTYGLALEHSPRAHILLGSSLGFATADYIGSTLEEESILAGLTAQYFLNQNLALTAAYQFTHYMNTFPGSAYDQNEFRVGMRMQR